MSEPFLGEVRIMGFQFAPRGWAQCDGQILQINQNQALFSLLGTTYGGDGRVTFGLPELRGRTPVHFSNDVRLGERAGEEVHTLTIAEMPTHAHTARATAAAASTGDPTGAFWANAGRTNFTTEAPNNSMNPASVLNTGGSQPHNNMPPFLTLNFCIALQGIFPSRN